MAEVTRWLPRIFVSACRKPSLVRPCCWSSRPAARGLPLGQHGQQQVLDRDVLVLEPVRLLLGRVQQAGQPLGDVDLPGARARAGDPGPPAEFGLQRGAQPVRVRAGLAEQPGSDALGLVEQREEQVLGVHLGVPEAERLGLRVVQRFG